MANLFAVRSVGSSLMTRLRNAYGAHPADLGSAFPCDFRLLSSGELAEIGDIGTTVSLYLYRVIINEHVRGKRHPNDPRGAAAPLSVDLHYLFSIWASSAAAENTLAAWLMNELHQHPILDSASLSGDAGWDDDEIVHIIPAELNNEDLMRIWDALAPSYRLSLTYIARVVRIDGPVEAPALSVVSTRFGYTETDGDDG